MLSFRSLFGEDADILEDVDFQILILASVMAPLGPGLVSPLLDSLTGPFGTSKAAIGLMISAFTAPGIVLTPFAGGIADRYGRRIVLIFGLLLFGIGGTAIALTTDFRVVLALRVVQGIGAVGMIPIIVASIGDLYGGTTEATGQGLRFMTSGFSNTVFPALAGVLVGIAWQYPFLIYALSFPLAGMVALWFEEPSQGNGDRRSISVARVGRLVLKPHIAALLVLFATPTFMYFGFVTYISVLIRLGGGSPAQAGLVVALNSIVFAIAGSQAGRITARFHSRLVPLIGTNAAMAGGLGLIAISSNVLVAGFGSAVLGVGFGITITLYRSVATRVAPEGLRASLVSLAETMNRVGATSAPIVFGAVITLTEPGLGFATATRWTILGMALACFGVGVAGILVMNRALSRL